MVLTITAALAMAGLTRLLVLASKYQRHQFLARALTVKSASGNQPPDLITTRDLDGFPDPLVRYLLCRCR
jgi:hypothetical protein